MTPLASAALWLLLTALGSAASLLPRWVELRLGPPLGRLVLRLGVFKRKTALENIRHCFPELGEAGWKSLLERNFEHYGILFFEFLHLFSPLPGHYRGYARKHCSLEGVEHWDRARARGKGVIFVSCHVGFWELVAASAGLTGRPITIVTTRLKPDWLDRLIASRRLSTGVRAAVHPGSAKDILRALRNGEAVAFMNDQYSGPPAGRLAEFFGVRVGTLAAAAPLARRTGAAVVPGAGYRDGGGVMRVRIEPELEFGPDSQDADTVTQAVASKVEAWVRAHPEQWLWMHRRFKHVAWPARP